MNKGQSTRKCVAQSYRGYPGAGRHASQMPFTGNVKET